MNPLFVPSSAANQGPSGTGGRSPTGKSAPAAMIEYGREHTVAHPWPATMLREGTTQPSGWHSASALRLPEPEPEPEPEMEMEMEPEPERAVEKRLLSPRPNGEAQVGSTSGMPSPVGGNRSSREMSSAGRNGTTALPVSVPLGTNTESARAPSIEKYDLVETIKDEDTVRPELELMRSLQQQISKMEAYDTRRMEAEEAMMLRMKREQEAQLEAIRFINKQQLAALQRHAAVQFTDQTVRLQQVELNRQGSSHELPHVASAPRLELRPEPEPRSAVEDGVEPTWHPGIVAQLPLSASGGKGATPASRARTGRGRTVSIESTVSFSSSPDKFMGSNEHIAKSSTAAGLELTLTEPPMGRAREEHSTPTPRSALRKPRQSSAVSNDADASVVSAAETLQLDNAVTPRIVGLQKRDNEPGPTQTTTIPEEDVFDPFEDAPNWRKFFMCLATNGTFQQFIVLTIVSNCAWMAFTTCSPDDTQCLEDARTSSTYLMIEYVFIAIYTVECFVMFMSYPPCGKRVDEDRILDVLAEAVDSLGTNEAPVFVGETSKSIRDDLSLSIRKYAPRIVVFVRADASTNPARKLLLLTTLLRECRTSDRIPNEQRPKFVMFLSSFPVESDGYTVDIHALRRIAVPGHDVADDAKRTREYVYLKDAWNWLDIACVISGYLDLLGLFDNMSFLRVMRVLRVLRTVTKIPMLKAIVQAVFKSGPMIVSTGVLVLLVVILFAISGVQLFGGALRQRCFDPELMSKNSTGPTADDPLCYRGTCPTGLECMVAAENADHGLAGFDTIGTSMLTVVQCISLEGWLGYTTQLSDAVSPWSAVYFLAIVFLVSLFTMNLVLAVLKDSLHTAMEKMRLHDERVSAEKSKLAERNKAVGKRFQHVQAQMVARSSLEIKCREIVLSPYFDKAIFSCIIINTLVLASEFPGMSKQHKYLSEIANFIFAFIFAVEMFLKIQGLGMKGYVRSGFNIFDGLVVILTIWSQLLLWMMDVKAADGSASIRLLYLLRILRLLKVFRYIQSLQLILENMRACVRPFLGIGVLLVVFLFIFTMAGLQLFGQKMPPESRSNFNTLGDSWVTVFQICTGEDWNQVMFDAVEQSGPLACIYFIICFMFGSYVVMDLMLAILLEKFQSEFNKRREKARLDKQQKPSTALAKMPPLKPLREVEDMEMLDPRYLTRELLHMYNDFQSAGVEMSARERRIHLQIRKFLKGGDVRTTSHDSSQNDRDRRKSIGDWLGQASQDTEPHVRDHESQPEENDCADSMSSSIASTVDVEPAEQLPRIALCMSAFAFTSSEEQKVKYDAKIYEGPSLGFIERDNCVRTGLASLIYSPGFRNTVLIFILASSLMLAIEPGIEDQETLDLLALVDWIFNTAFLLEALFKIVVYGFVAHEKAYLRGGANCLDFFLVVSSFALNGMKSLRTVRVLRPLRAVSRDPGMQLVLNTLVRSGPELSNVGVFLAVVWTVFGILGVAFFGGQFNSCNDRMELWNGANVTSLIPGTGCVGSFVADDGTLSEREWTRAYFNFDHFGQACITLFVVSTREGWLDIMWNGMDATGVGFQPIAEHSWYNCIFFLAFIMIGYYFVLNIFLGVIFDHFSLLKAEQGGPVFATAKQKEWFDATNVLRTLRLPYLAPPPPAGSSSLKIVAFQLAEGPGKAATYFDYAIIVCIFANIGTMMTQSYDQTDEWTDILFLCELVFTLIFAFEAAIKIYGLGFDNYTKVFLNQVDFFIVVASLLDLSFSLAFLATDTEENGDSGGAGRLFSLLRCVRIFRLAKLVRNFKSAERVQRLLLTLYQSFPAMKNVGGVLLILYYTFAVLGTSLFANAERRGEVDEHTNFDSFGSAMLTLCRISTGEGWPAVLQSLVDGLKDDHLDHQGDFIEGNSFVRVSGPLFFISFIILSDFFFFNLLATIVIDQYDSVEETAEDFESINLGRSLQKFKDAWTDKDANAVGAMDPSTFALLIQDTQQPIGIATAHTRSMSESEQRRLVNVRMSAMRVPIRSDGLIHFRDAMLHVARHLIGLDVDDKMVRTIASRIDADTNALVSAGGSLKDEYVGVIGRLKILGSRIGAVTEGPAVTGSRRGRTPMAPSYTTHELIAAQRIQKKWRQHVEVRQGTRLGLSARHDQPTGVAQWT